MIVLYRSSSLESVSQAERDLIEHNKASALGKSFPLAFS